MTIEELETTRLAALKVQTKYGEWREAVNDLYYSPANKLAGNKLGSTAVLILCNAATERGSPAKHMTDLAEAIIDHVDSELNKHKAREIEREQHRQAQERQKRALPRPRQLHRR